MDRVVNLQKYKLARQDLRDTVSEVGATTSNASPQRDPGRLLSRSGNRAVEGPLPLQEAPMNHSAAKADPRALPRRWGRPPKLKSDASLTKRLQIMLSNHDAEMIEEIMQATRVASMGQVIRDAVRRDFERIVSEKKHTKIPK